jgi:hypothetical protein
MVRRLLEKSRAMSSPSVIPRATYGTDGAPTTPVMGICSHTVQFSPSLLPANGLETHWAGAQRPNSCGGDDSHHEAVTLQSNPAERVNTHQGALNLKLRKQASALGMVPGSPRWRAYVLGTVSAMAKRKRKKDSKC